MYITTKLSLVLASFSLTAVLLSPIIVGCENTREAIDNLDSRVVCAEYCNKKYDCESHDPTDDEKSTCNDSCRNSIENDCGNDNQAAANNKIGECVDKSCAEFLLCMVFEADPACFGFVN